MPKVFISHSSLDREFVEREIITPLSTHGIETWYSTDDIRTAEAWERSIREGLRSCDWFLVVMSPNSVASRWVQREVHWAIERREERVIPVLIETCEPEDLHLGLLPIQHIDFRQNIKGAQKKLLAIWGAERERKSLVIEEGTQLKEDAGQSIKSEITPSKVEGKLTETQKLYLDYWTDFREFLQRHNSFLTPQKPQAQNWFPLAIGRTNVALVATIHRKGRRIATNLSLYGPDAKPHFHLLRQDKTAIESEIGESLEWRELASGKESHIRLSKHKTDPANRQDWETQHTWLQEKLELFYRVFAQRIKKLNASDYLPSSQSAEKQAHTWTETEEGADRDKEEEARRRQAEKERQLAEIRQRRKLWAESEDMLSPAAAEERERIEREERERRRGKGAVTEEQSVTQSTSSQQPKSLRASHSRQYWLQRIIGISILCLIPIIIVVAIKEFSPKAGDNSNDKPVLANQNVSNENINSSVNQNIESHETVSNNSSANKADNSNTKAENTLNENSDKTRNTNLSTPSVSPLPTPSQAENSKSEPTPSPAPTKEGRAILTADKPLNDYSAYRSGGRIYVVIPGNPERHLLPLKVSGLEDYKVSMRGNDTVFSFGIPSGMSGRVDQRFNRLEVIIH